jgi:hypothetical protein
MASMLNDPQRFHKVVLQSQARPQAETVEVFGMRDGRQLERHAGPYRISGRCVGVLVHWRDVTERQRAAAALLAKEVAERANRAKSEFLARMSHELRSPLNAIIGFSDVLRIDPQQPLTATQHKRVGHIRRAGANLLMLINDVLDVARLEAGQMKTQLEDVDVSAVIEEMVAQTEPQATAAGISLRIGNLPARRGLVRADGVRIRQILLNLLSNAIKYNVPNGSVVVHLVFAAGRAHVVVADTGLGMTVQQLAGLYQPFNRLGREGTGIEGTGIGLVISRSLAELMGGTLDVRSRSGEGTEFTLTLDEVEGAVPDAAAPSAPMPFEESVDTITGRVVYIDDDEMNRVLMEAFFAHRPQVQLSMAADGAAGLSLARQIQPDLILLDLMLPGMDGFAVLHALRADPAIRRVPCLAVSASAMSDEIERARAAGFDGYLTKPLTLAEFLTEIDARLRPVVQGSVSLI